MAVNIHLVTMVGGLINLLPQMLEHYRAMGIDSFFVNVHQADEYDPALERTRAVTDRFGCGIASVTQGNWVGDQRNVYMLQRARYPDDWFILADQDEFQVYPANLREVIEECDAQGFDHIRGCFIDRIARDGSFPVTNPERPVWEQFPLGAYLSPILGADPRKVVALKGALPVVTGQHHTLAGRACPTRQYFVPVYHFKWADQILERLTERALKFRSLGIGHWVESASFVNFCAQAGGRIPVNDPRLFVAECDPMYRQWDAVQKIVTRLPIPDYVTRGRELYKSGGL